MRAWVLKSSQESLMSPGYDSVSRREWKQQAATKDFYYGKRGNSLHGKNFFINWLFYNGMQFFNSVILLIAPAMCFKLWKPDFLNMVTFSITSNSLALCFNLLLCFVFWLPFLLLDKNLLENLLHSVRGFLVFSGIWGWSKGCANLHHQTLSTAHILLF